MDSSREMERLRSIGDEYYEACFTNDLSVCSGRTKEGKPVPINRTETTKVNTYAHKKFRVLCEKYQLSNKEMMKALRYSRREY